MTDVTFDLTIIQIMAILRHYGFDLRGYTALELIDQWGNLYSALWMRLAIIEALYQGRYKALSIEQILQHWLRKGKPTIHFSHEFERLICHNLPQGIEKSPAFVIPEESNQNTIENLDSELPHSPKNSQKAEINSSSSQSEQNSHQTPVPKEATICQFTPCVDHSPCYAKLRETIYKGLEKDQNPE